MSKNRGGRPTKMTEETLKKLEEGFSWCYTDEEACLYAGISPTTLYNYQSEHPEFVERKQALRLTPNLAAKKTLANGLDNNVGNARWWAENKMAEEFAPKKKVELGGKVQTEDVSVSAGITKVVNEFEEKLRAQIVSERKGV